MHVQVLSKVVRSDMFSSNWLALFIICKCFSIVWTLAPPSTTTPNCTNVMHVFESYGITKAEIARNFVTGKSLRYCESVPSLSCCSTGIEMKAISSIKLQLEKAIMDSIKKLSSVLGLRAVKFNDFFEQLLAESKKEFHIMFKKTYGVLYEQNSYVFSDFFTELEKYYSSGKVDLAEAIDSFFNTLYQKMFTVLNAQYSFNDKYLGCVSEHMKELKPFGDVPDKLSVQIKRSFVATRTYAQALATASEVAKKLMNVRLGENCTAALMRMQFCGSCKGYSEKPCASYCENVVKSCLHFYNEIDTEWDNFASSMEKVSERLLGPFNIVVVVEPINIKISEAIMNFQETGQDISNQVFQGCGRPSLGRRLRSVKNNMVESSKSKISKANTNRHISYQDNTKYRFTRSIEKEKESQYVPVQSSNPNEQSNVKHKKKNKKKNSNSKESEDDETSREPILNKLVKDIRQKVKDSKKFWHNLPYQICNNENYAAPPEVDKHCWNGNTIDGYTQSVVMEYASSSEFSTSNTFSRQSSLVGNQLYYLKTVVNHLRNAYNGLDVEWSDQDEPYYGSGSGSGDGIDDEDGSGLSSSEDTHPHMPLNVDTSSVHGNMPTGVTSFNATGTNYIPTDRDSKNSHETNAAPRMSLRQALITYFFPIYMAWFGSIISDFL